MNTDTIDVATEEPDDDGICPECGASGFWYEDDKQNCQVIAHCDGCGGWEDSYADLYGVMSIPWGFAL